jgi:hypothetical protein
MIGCKNHARDTKSAKTSAKTNPNSPRLAKSKQRDRTNTGKLFQDAQPCPIGFLPLFRLLCQVSG